MSWKALEQIVKWIIVGVILFFGFATLNSCANKLPYNYRFRIEADKVIKAEEWDSSSYTHIVQAKDGNVYRIFHVPVTYKDSVYHAVKRYSYGRERALEYYFVYRQE